MRLVVAFAALAVFAVFDYDVPAFGVLAVLALLPPLPFFELHPPLPFPPLPIPLDDDVPLALEDFLEDLEDESGHSVGAAVAVFDTTGAATGTATGVVYSTSCTGTDISGLRSSEGAASTHTARRTAHRSTLPDPHPLPMPTTESVWTLCLTCPGHPRVTERMPSSTTVGELHAMAARAFATVVPNKKKDDKKSTSSSSSTSDGGDGDGGGVVVSLQVGYPPRRLEVDSTQRLDEAGLGPQERVSVTVTTANHNHHNHHHNSPSSSPTDTRRKRPRRQAALAADASWADTIQEEDARRTAATTQRRSHTKPKNDTQSVARRHFAKLAAQTKGSTTTTTTQHARRLRDGQVMVAPSRRPTASLDHGLVATQAGLVRQGWKAAVQSRYEQNKAVARVAATTAWTATACLRGTRDTATEQPPWLVIAYPKGVQGRGTFEDTVDWLPLDALRAAVASIHPQNPNALTPHTLALVSPRVFWSIWHHYGCDHSASDCGNGGMEAALRWVCPDLDWSLVHQRPRALSAKARENARQEAAAKHKDQPQEDWEAAAAAIASVEEAMDHGPTNHNHTDSTRNDSALDDATTAVDAVRWVVDTPDEEDRDELTDCVRAYQCASHNSQVYPRESVVDALLLIGIHNWRELANAADDDDDDGNGNGIAKLYNELVLVLDKKTKGSQTKPLPDTTRTMEVDEEVLVSLESVQAWIDHAQSESVAEIMVEVCEGNVEAVELLRDVAHSGTPQELALWQAIPHTLHEHVVILPQSRRRRRRTEECDHGDTHDESVPSVPQLTRWCHRAVSALEQLEWLRLYATPISGS